MLSGNQLESLPTEMSNCKEIELMRLSVNRLSELPDWLSQLPRLAWIAYSGNPFQERCHLNDNATSVPVDWSELAIAHQLGEGASGHVFKAFLSGECECHGSRNY
jgi:hypothetical protein